MFPNKTLIIVELTHNFERTVIERPFLSPLHGTVHGTMESLVTNSRCVNKVVVWVLVQYNCLYKLQKLTMHNFGIITHNQIMTKVRHGGFKPLFTRYKNILSEKVSGI